MFTLNPGQTVKVTCNNYITIVDDSVQALSLCVHASSAQCMKIF